MSISVLIIGASGAFGQPLLQEFLNQKSSFKSIAILASSTQKAAKFSHLEEQGVKIVVGSLLDPKSYIGTPPFPSPNPNPNPGFQKLMVCLSLVQVSMP
jgi:Semialdehyde dehydrogenase, NAD binding domain